MSEKTIEFSFYDKTEEEQFRFIKNMKRKIANGDNALLKQMMSIVDEEVMSYEADFYVHDVELLKEIEDDEAVLWIVRNRGTHFVFLSNDSFNSKGEWATAEYFKAILHNHVNEIGGYYLIQKGKLEKLNKKSALATISIYEDIAKNKQKYQSSLSSSIV